MSKTKPHNSKSLHNWNLTTFTLTISTTTIALTMLGCAHKSNSTDGHSVRPASSLTGSCYFTVFGQVGRCMEYGNAIDEQTFNYSKSICGSERNGLKGFIWADQPCPTSNQVGECIYNTDTHAFRNFYYGPTYSLDQAAKDCKDGNGTLK